MEQFFIFLAFAFALIDEFHDSANSIAIIVITRALYPGKDVIWPAFFDFIHSIRRIESLR